MSKYQYTDDMRELSGFGGGYEATCRAMVVAGLEHLDANPQSDPQFRGYKNIYGIITADNADGKALSEAVVKASGGDCTGAMHQVAISHILWIRKNGWERYCAESREHNAAVEKAMEGSAMKSETLLDASLRKHVNEITEYILRGNGRKIVPKAIYLAAWELQYALNRTSNARKEEK